MTNDVYKYFRIEARELADALGHAVLELERGPLPPERLAQVFRQAHTLKGAARVVRRVRIADLAHDIEETLGPYRDGSRAVPEDAATTLLALVDAIKADLASLDAPSEIGSPAPVAEGATRLGAEDLDQVSLGLLDVAVQVGGLVDSAAGVDGARRIAAAALRDLERLGEPAAKARAHCDELVRRLTALRHDLSSGVGRVRARVDAVRAHADRLRLVPAESLFAALERAARDAAGSKRVAFEATGGYHRLDLQVLGGVRDALLHVVRNAATHGIEAAPDRHASGKRPDGSIRLDVSQRGSLVAFTCTDDGRGVDVAAVRRAAVRHGLIDDAAALRMSDADTLRLVLEPGLTTAAVVSQSAGRGIGLDAARTSILRLRGDIDVTSTPGHGTTVVLRVPVSLTALKGLRVESGNVRAIVPLRGVVRTLRAGPDARVRTPDGDRLHVDGGLVPVIGLRQLLGPTDATDRGPLVLVESGGARAALEVGGIRGTVEVVVRPLPASLGRHPALSGAAFDDDGAPVPVLDTGGLILAAHRTAYSVPGATPETRAPILVCDDSLTTRMLEQSILESAGYAVELASSAEEALELTSRQRYSLFLVDVEMPGMDGFTFVERTRADPRLQAVPAILVTSRGSTADRLRGLAAGASAYIAKSEFDQAQLLATIRALVGFA